MSLVWNSINESLPPMCDRVLVWSDARQQWLPGRRVRLSLYNDPSLGFACADGKCVFIDDRSIPIANVASWVAVTAGEA